MKVTWKDVTVHDQRATDKTPKTWQAKFAGLRVTVTRHFAYAPTTWLLRCEPWFDTLPVGEAGVEEAQQTALQLLRDKLASAIAEIDGPPRPRQPVPGAIFDGRGLGEGRVILVDEGTEDLRCAEQGARRLYAEPIAQSSLQITDRVLAAAREAHGTSLMKDLHGCPVLAAVTAAVGVLRSAA